MKRNKDRPRNLAAKALRHPLFRQKVVPSARNYKRKPRMGRKAHPEALLFLVCSRSYV